MTTSRLAASFAVLLAAAMGLSGCAVNEQAAPAGPSVAAGGLSGTLNGKGASSMKAAQKKWQADFQTANPGVTVNYSPDGSGAGREGFLAGAVQFAGSDRAFKDSEMGPGNFAGCAPDSDALNLPVYLSPIAVVFKVDGVTELLLDADTLAGIFTGAIARWDDPRITALNPGQRMPDAPITAVHRSDDSGTTENFTDYLHVAAPEVWTEEPDGQWPTAYVGEAAKGTSGVVDAVTIGRNTIGYADEAAAGGLGQARLKVGDEFLGPTADAVARIVDAAERRAEGRPDLDLALDLDRTAPGAYPAVLVSYLLVCEEYADPADADLVKAFVGYVASDAGQRSAQADAGNAPLSPAMAARVRAAVDSIS